MILIYFFSGSHRPAWARYGEYKFLPKQRWLHNLEVYFIINKISCIYICVCVCLIAWIGCYVISPMYSSSFNPTYADGFKGMPIQTYYYTL